MVLDVLIKENRRSKLIPREKYVNFNNIRKGIFRNLTELLLELSHQYQSKPTTEIKEITYMTSLYGVETVYASISSIDSIAKYVLSINYKEEAEDKKDLVNLVEDAITDIFDAKERFRVEDLNEEMKKVFDYTAIVLYKQGKSLHEISREVFREIGIKPRWLTMNDLNKYIRERVRGVYKIETKCKKRKQILEEIRVREMDEKRREGFRNYLWAGTEEMASKVAFSMYNSISGKDGLEEPKLTEVIKFLAEPHGINPVDKIGGEERLLSRSVLRTILNKRKEMPKSRDRLADGRLFGYS